MRKEVVRINWGRGREDNTEKGRAREGEQDKETSWQKNLGRGGGRK